MLVRACSLPGNKDVRGFSPKPIAAAVGGGGGGGGGDGGVAVAAHITTWSQHGLPTTH